jgi:hypothetical protein
MKLTKEEKKIWQRHFRIEKLENIPKEMTGYTSIDGDADNELMFYLAKRVSTPEMYLKCTLVTDEGVGHISKIQRLKDLTLRDHKKVTKASIHHFNQMQQLEKLNITLTKITLSDLCESLNNQSLKEIFLSSEEGEKDIEEKGFILKERMPGCDIYLDCSQSTDEFGNCEKPIF